MAYKPTDRTRFDRAKQLAEQIVDESSQGDGFTLVLMADPPQVIVGTPSFAPADFLGEIARRKAHPRRRRPGRHARRGRESPRLRQARASALGPGAGVLSHRPGAARAGRLI